MKLYRKLGGLIRREGRADDVREAIPAELAAAVLADEEALMLVVGKYGEKTREQLGRLEAAEGGTSSDEGGGDAEPGAGSDFEDDYTRDKPRIEALVAEGHSEHCACRQVWGDGECECDLSGETLEDRWNRSMRLRAAARQERRWHARAFVAEDALKRIREILADVPAIWPEPEDTVREINLGGEPWRAFLGTAELVAERDRLRGEVNRLYARLCRFEDVELDPHPVQPADAPEGLEWRGPAPDDAEPEDKQ